MLDKINKNEANNKKKRIIVMSFLAVIAVVVAVIVIAGSKGRQFKKCINLGQKYLENMNYEEAIASFEKALEIDPMSAEAYLGMADAYIGMGIEKLNINNYDDALTLYIEAKTVVEKGIDVLSGVDEDTTLLERKLKEVQEEITKIEDEIAKAEEARLKAEKEEAEEERLAAIPKVYVKPFIDELDNVWGKNWKEWTIEDYVAAFGLSPWYNTNTNWSSKGSQQLRNEKGKIAGVSLEGKIDFGDVYVYGNGATYGDETITIWPEYRQYYKAIISINPDVTVNSLYSLCVDNGITSIDGALNYFGLSEVLAESNPGEPVQVMTEYGLAEARINTADNFSSLKFSGFEGNEDLHLVFGHSGGFGNDEMTEFYVVFQDNN